MVNKNSVQKLVRPLRKLPFIKPSPSSKSQLSLVLEEKKEEYVQQDLISLLPYEIALYIFSMLSFQDLFQIQLTSKSWCRLAQSSSIWKPRCIAILKDHQDLSFINPSKRIKCEKEEKEDEDEEEDCKLLRSSSWPSTYCRLQSSLNWKMGSVQHANLIQDSSGLRILSVKLKDHLLVTLLEDNVVNLYEYQNRQFILKNTWSFGDTSQQQNIVECIDILPEINILVVALRGSKCIFYDITKNSSDPIQVLKGGSHAWFIPDSICLSRDYFAVSGRKPSVVFVYKWRKGVRLSNKAFDNQPHRVYISGDQLITASVDGTVHVFDIMNEKNCRIFRIPPCSIPSLDYDGGLSLFVAPFNTNRLHQFIWKPQTNTMPTKSSSSSLLQQKNQNKNSARVPQKSKSSSLITPSSSTSSTSSTKPLKMIKRRFSNSFGLFNNNDNNNNNNNNSSNAFKGRIRRHSSYNDYGYACQARTEQYIKEKVEKGLIQPTSSTILPDFDQPLALDKTICTSPLGKTGLEIINIATTTTTYHKKEVESDEGEEKEINGRVVTLNKHGDMAIYKTDGTMAARIHYHQQYPWMEKWETVAREDDDLSDGYDFIRSRLAIGKMGVVYGGRNGSLWHLDFSVKPI